MERPYRIWNEQAKQYERWRCYGYLEHAKVAGWILAKQQKVGTTLAVMHHETKKLFGQYTRHFDRKLGDIVTFRGERDELATPAKHGKRSNNVHSIKRKAKRKAKRKETVDKETGEVRSAA
jgi:hypothetical protein